MTEIQGSELQVVQGLVEAHGGCMLEPDSQELHREVLIEKTDLKENAKQIEEELSEVTLTHSDKMSWHECLT